MNKIDGQKKNWDDIWSTSNKLNWFGRRLRVAQVKTIKKILKEINLPHSAKILDMGCGSGRSLSDLRNLGYKNSFGIDTSLESIELCGRNGFLRDKDVFLMDGANTSFDDSEFDMVFSVGLLEHFEDFTPFVKEMTRISNRYVLLLQPNHFSLYRRIIDAVSGTPVDEYTCYGVKEYVGKFEKFDWKLVHRVGYNLNEQFALLFEKMNFKSK
jgi:SAM-dependent methyltransferase